MQNKLYLDLPAIEVQNLIKKASTKTYKKKKCKIPQLLSCNSFILYLKLMNIVINILQLIIFNSFNISILFVILSKFVIQIKRL